MNLKSEIRILEIRKKTELRIPKTICGRCTGMCGKHTRPVALLRASASAFFQISDFDAPILFILSILSKTRHVHPNRNEIRAMTLLPKLCWSRSNISLRR